MKNAKQTSKEVAGMASDILLDTDTGKKAKKVAGSVLSQSGGQEKQTSGKVASVASDILQDRKEDKNTRKVAGSALSQTKKK